MIRILIVDDQSLIREGLSMMLSLYDSVTIVGEAKNGHEAIETLENVDIDLILMDIRMPIMDGVEATRIIKDKYPKIKVLILTTFNEDKYIFEGLRNGADGYLLKDLSSEELVKAIETVYQGNMLLQPAIAKQVINSIHKKGDDINKVNKDIFNQLTKREYEVALLVGEGKSNKEISRELFITEGTVKNHITKILDKLEIRDRTQLSVLINNK